VRQRAFIENNMKPLLLGDCRHFSTAAVTPMMLIN
jgi:hypothetical protein